MTYTWNSAAGAFGTADDPSSKNCILTGQESTEPGETLSATGRPQVSAAPASTVICSPVTKRDSSLAKKTTAADTSDGSTYGTGIAWMLANASSTSSRPGWSRS